MTTAHPPESRSADSTAVSDEGQAPPLVHEMAPGQRFPSPNQVDMERGPFWRAGLLPESPWEAHPVTIIANLGEPIGESRLKADSSASKNNGPLSGAKRTFGQIANVERLAGDECPDPGKSGSRFGMNGGFHQQSTDCCCPGVPKPMDQYPSVAGGKASKVSTPHVHIRQSCSPYSPRPPDTPLLHCSTAPLLHLLHCSTAPLLH